MKGLFFGAKMAAVVTVGVSMLLLAADPAEAKKRHRKSSHNSYKAVSCCKTYGVYHPRMTHTSSNSERFFKAIAYRGE